MEENLEKKLYEFIFNRKILKARKYGISIKSRYLIDINEVNHDVVIFINSKIDGTDISHCYLFNRLSIEVQEKIYNEVIEIPKEPEVFLDTHNISEEKIIKDKKLKLKNLFGKGAIYNPK